MALKAIFNSPISQKSLDLLQSGQMIDPRVGSSLFNAIWENEKHNLSPIQLIKLVLTIVQMPSELSGELSETRSLLANFHPDLAPDHSFWLDFSEQVNLAFPGKALSEKSPFTKKVHQFRYLISSQQAEYIRSHYGNDKTDAQALAYYLSGKTSGHFWRKRSDYSLKDSARLHNKLLKRGEAFLFPEEIVSFNIKVLLHFHSEFIISSTGDFLNEIDGQKSNIMGIVNGASFNYGTPGKRHWDLDVDPVRPLDPTFRNKVTKGYYSPKNIESKWFQKPQGYELSYFNKRGVYSYQDKSAEKQVSLEMRKFRKMIRKLS